MTNKIKDTIIDDAIGMGLLIEVCSICANPTSLTAAKFENVEFIPCNCVGINDLRWNRRLLKLWEAETLNDESQHDI